MFERIVVLSDLYNPNIVCSKHFKNEIHEMVEKLLPNKEKYLVKATEIMTKQLALPQISTIENLFSDLKRFMRKSRETNKYLLYF